MSADKCPNCTGLGLLPTFSTWRVCPVCKGTGLATPNEKEGTAMNEDTGIKPQQPITIRKITEFEYEGREVTVEVSLTYPEREESVAKRFLETVFNETYHVLEDHEARNV